MKESVNRADLRSTQKMCSSWQYFLSTITITIITIHLRLTQKMCFSSPYFLSTGSRHFSKPSTEVWPAPKRGKPGSWNINSQKSIVKHQKKKKNWIQFFLRKRKDRWHLCMSIRIVRTEDSWQGQWPWARFFHRVESESCKMSLLALQENSLVVVWQEHFLLS